MKLYHESEGTPLSETEERPKKGDSVECANSAMSVPPDVPAMCLRVIFYGFLSWFLLLIK